MNFREYVEKRRSGEITGQEDEQQVSTEQTGSGFREYVKQRRTAEAVEKLGNRVNAWVESANSFVNDYNSRFSSREEGKYVADSQHWLAQSTSRKTALDAEAQSIRDMIGKYGDYLDSGWVSNVGGILQSGSGDIDKLLQYSQQDADFWAQFDPTQEQAAQGITADSLYGQWYTDNSYRQKYAGQSYSQLAQTLAQMEDGEERNWLENYAPTVMTTQDMEGEIQSNEEKLAALQDTLSQANALVDSIGMGGDPDGLIHEELKALLKNAGFRNTTELNNAIEALRADSWHLEQRVKYDMLPQNADYAQQSQKVADAPTAGFGVGIGTSWWGQGDPVYDYINDINGTQKNKKASSAFKGSPYSIYSNMKDAEIANYNYLYNTKGKKAADEYLDYLEYALSERQMAVAAGNAKLLADNAPVLASAISVPTNLMSGIGTLDIIGQNAIKGIKEAVTGEYAGPVNYNSNAMLPTVATTSIRGTVAQNIADTTGRIQLDSQKHPVLSKMLNGKSLGDVYQLGMSMVDSGAVALMTPFVGSAGTALLGGSAASRGILDAVEAGASDFQALAMGLLNGGFEMLFEKVSLENLLNGNTRSIVRKIITQGLVEGSEELNTSLANTLADTIIMADKSQLKRSIAAYIESGFTEQEATKKALADIAVQMGWDFVGGVISGGIMGGIAAPIQNYQYAAEEGNRIYGSNPQGLIGEVLDIDAENALAGKMRKRLEQGKGVSGKQLYDLAQQKEAALRKQDITTIQNAAKARLVELGETGAVDAVAAALAKESAGQQLTKAERQAISKSKYGQRVSNELNAENIDSGGYSSGWAKSIGTQRINAKEYSRSKGLQQVALETDGGKTVTAPMAAEKTARRQDVDTVNKQAVAATTAVPENANRGKAHLVTDPDKTVTVKEIAELKNGSAKLLLEDGTVVDAADVEFDNEGEAMLYDVVAQMGIPRVSTANVLADGIHLSKAQNMEDYAAGIEEAFRFGQQNIPKQELRTSTYASLLDPSRQDFAYRQGQKMAGKQIARKQANIDAAYEQAKTALAQNGTKPHEHGVLMAEGIEKGTMDKSQRASYNLAEKIAPAVKCDILVYKGGKEWGYYNSKTDTICLNINAKWSQASMMAFTLSHELVHRAKLGSPVRFKTFANFLIREYGKQGSDIEAMIAEQLAAAKEAGIEMTEGEAYEEVICDACQRMLLDTDAGKKLAEFGAQSQQNKNFVKEFGKWLKALLEKLRSIFRNVDPDSLAAREFQKFNDTVKRILADMFVDMSLDAGEKLSTIKAAGMTEKITTGEGGVKSKVGVMTEADIRVVQSIGRKSVNQFSAADIKATEQFAHRYWQEMGVKSPFFRAWFGDWRANDQTKVQIANQKGDARGVQKNADTGWDIQVSGQVFNETNRHTESYNVAAKAYLPYINSIVENAVLLDSFGIDPRKPKSHNSLLMHSLYAVADIGNGLAIIKLYVEEMNNPNTENTGKRAYQLQNVEKYQLQNGSSQKNASSRSSTTGNIRTVADLFAAVKQKDTSFNPKPASKVVNPDGTPMVMYHGSPAQFTIFDRKKAKSSGQYGRGFYFTNSQSHAGTYGQQYNVYLNIRNPLQHGAGKVSRAQVRRFLEAVAENEDYAIENYGSYDIDSALRTVMGSAPSIDAFQAIQDINATAIGDMVEAAELFNKVNGTKFDGIVAATETVAFYPEQIKGATDNIGTFDGSNPDIRFKVPVASEGYDTTNLHWAIENEIISEEDQARFWEAIAEISKRKYNSFARTKDGGYIIENGTKMMFTDGDFKAPTLSKVIEFVYGEYVDTSEERTRIRNEARLYGSTDKSTKALENMYGPGFVTQYDARNYSAYGRKVGRGERAYRTGPNFQGEGREIRQSGEDRLHPGQKIDRKLPVAEDTSPRALLANAFEGMAQNEAERQRIAEYRENLDALNEQEQKLAEINAQIRELSFGKGPKDKAKLTNLQSEKTKITNRINYYDKKLLKLETAKPLQDVLEREKKRAYDRARLKGREAMADMRSRMTETAEKRTAREKLQKLVLDTVKWITHPAKTDVRCPDFLKKPYSDFLGSIDLSSQRLGKGGDPTKADLRLANAMNQLATALGKVMEAQDPGKTNVEDIDSGYLDLPVNFVAELQRMAQKVTDMMVEGEYVANTMPAADVRKLSQMIRTLNHAIKEVSRLYANMRFANVEALGTDSMEYMAALGTAQESGGIKDFVTWDNALPFYAFKRFGKGGESVFEGLMDGQDKLAQLAKEIFDFQKKTWTEKEAKAWSEDTHTIELSDGELTLTTADAMSIYCTARRDNNHGLQHLLGGGVRVMGLQKGSKKAQDSHALLTVEDISTISDSLTVRQKEVAEALQEFMSTVCAEWGNEISMKRFLTKDFSESRYFPIESNDENMTVKDPAAQQSDLFRLLNISATKPLTPKANNEVIIRNIFDVFTNHTADMARLNAFGMALLDYMKWFNYRQKTVKDSGQIDVKGVRKSMEIAYGKTAGSYVMNLIKDVNGRPSDGGLPQFYERMLRNAKTAMVGNSARVAALQVTSYPRAALVLSPKNLALGLSKKPNIERAKKYCGIALWKSYGFYDTNISRSLEEQIRGKTNLQQKMIEWSLKGAELGDALTWGCLWNACEYEVAATKQYDIGTEEFYQAVGRKLREVVYSTQVVDSVLTRSQMMRSKNAKTKEISSFMSEPTLSANILMDAGMQFQAEKRRAGSAKTAWQKTGKLIGRAIAVYSIGQISAALVEGLFDAWRDDEDDKFRDKYLKALGQNLILDLLPFNKIPIISEFAEALLSMAGVGYFSTDSLYSTAVSQTVSALNTWKSVLNGSSSATVYNGIYKTVRAISSFGGVAIGGAMREAVALWNNTAGAYNPTWKILQTKRSKTELGELLYVAITEENDRWIKSIRGEFADSSESTKYLKTAVKEHFTTGELDGDTATQFLKKHCDMSDSEAQADIAYWDHKRENPDSEVSSAWFDSYYKKVAGSGISIDTYLAYRNKAKDMDTKEQKLRVIHSLQLTKAQKDALYLAEGWAESGLADTPWH